MSFDIANIHCSPELYDLPIATSGHGNERVVNASRHSDWIPNRFQHLQIG